ncbi:MAG: DUF5406 domain-containing protein [Treponema sp.]|jgi:hypothetical protein|nr:DUF5406 domain-containing protein [Treponema sp.]
MNYDPNLVFCGRMATQTVQLTFGLWEYRKAIVVTVGGNCRGLSVIEAAVENVYNQLSNAPHASEAKTMTLVNKKGEEMETTEDEEDWLKNMLIKAEIIAIRPSKE